MSTNERRRERARLAATLRDRREALGLSRRDVADRSGLSYPYVSQLENGDREPSLDALSKLGSAFGVPVEDLLKPQHERLLEAPAEPEAAGDWHANPAYALSPSPIRVSTPTRSRSRRRRVDVDLAVDDAYTALLTLPPDERLDAAGTLLARCLRDASGPA